MKIFIAAPFGNYIKTSNTISVTGSWTIEKRNGRIKQILKTLRYTKRGWVNKIGLRNPGFDYGIKNHKENDVFSIAGIEKDDWKFFAEMIPNDLNLEVNPIKLLSPSRFLKINACCSPLLKPKPAGFKFKASRLSAILIDDPLHIYVF